MDEIENLIYKSFGIFQYHLDYLNSVNKNNVNDALRNTLDRVINIDKQNNKKQFLNQLKDNLVIISIGMIFFLFGIVSTNLLTIILSLGIGIFFVTYGLVTIKVRRI